jgi:hypothetical protein
MLSSDSENDSPFEAFLLAGLDKFGGGTTGIGSVETARPAQRE